MPVRDIRSSAPVRIADLGGWTDTWFAGTGVVCSLAVRPGARVSLSAVDGAGEVVIEAVDFGHRYSLAADRGKHPLLEAAIDEVGLPAGLDVVVRVSSPIPPGASTGTSAAVTVALVGALLFLRDGEVDRDVVARTAHRVEAVRLATQTGIQDQLAAVHGGANRIDMTAYPSATVTPLSIPARALDELGRRLVLVFLGRTHVSSAVHEEVIAALERSSPSDVDRRLEPLRQAARDGARALQAGDLDAYGAALVANTNAQSALHPSLVSADARRLFDAARSWGCRGWKVNGAGGEGGSVTLLCGPEPRGRQRVLDALAGVDPAFAAIETTLDGDGLRVWSATGAGYIGPMPENDPHTEPENSTVDDWMGQEVNEDMELADKLVEENDGDLAKAEEQFDQQSAGAEPDPQNVPRAHGKGHS